MSGSRNGADMKLNPDCVRDVMLELEKELGIEKKSKKIYQFLALDVYDLASRMEEKFGYRGEDVVYSALQLWESGYIVTNGKHPVYGNMDTVEMGGIIYITPKGHEFISAIHSTKTWAEKISPVLKRIGNVSLSIIESVSKGITTSIIEQIISPAIP